MIFKQEGKNNNYFVRFSEDNRSGYVDNYLSERSVDTAALRRIVRRRIRRLEQCLAAIEEAEGKNNDA